MLLFVVSVIVCRLPNFLLCWLVRVLLYLLKHSLRYQGHFVLLLTDAFVIAVIVFLDLDVLEVFSLFSHIVIMLNFFTSQVNFVALRVVASSYNDRWLLVVLARLSRDFLIDEHSVKIGMLYFG